MTDDESDRPTAGPGPPAAWRSDGDSAPAASALPPLADVDDGIDGPEVAAAKERGRRTWPWVPFVVVVVGGAAASRANLAYSPIQPGTAQSVQHFITVPPGKDHPRSEEHTS